MSDQGSALEKLQRELSAKEKRKTISFTEYLELVKNDPRRMLRSIFQLFYDMVDEYVEADEEEVDHDPESIGFKKYDCSKLFVEGADNPFFADTPFANRFVRQTGNLRQGFQQNRVYVYDGPSGCGKSTFLNNILRTFASYTNTPEGQTLEVFWDIDEQSLVEESKDKLRVPCPSHDYPILIIPKNYRADFLDNLLPESEIKTQIFKKKEYAWIFQGEACTICKSLFASLFEKLGSIDKVLEMVKARPYRFDRRTGEGISIFNPGDKPLWGAAGNMPLGQYFTNNKIQERLNRLFGINTVRYMYSSLAKTNNGIYALMDVKAHNRERLIELHNVISEGVHKVGDIEERVHSLFFALMNPEDKSIIEDEKMESFKGRIQYNPVSYVLEPVTEANIYKNIFGQPLCDRFLPRVLENFARVIISSRMNLECEPQQEWISDMDAYKLFCDKNGLLLRMEIYSNNIPGWLSEKDKKSFTAPVRKAVIGEGQNEGKKGFSGRDSIALFSDFFSRYGGRETLINMGHVVEFFKRDIGRDRRDENIPKGFLRSLVNSYDYAVLGEVKEALYFYNREQVSTDILNYLCAVSYDIGDTVHCEHTGQKFELTVEFLQRMAGYLTGNDLNEEDALRYARYIQKEYITVVASAQTEITETDLYEELFEDYARNLKDKALDPLVENKNFREAIKAFDTDDFDIFDSKLKKRVSRMITNLEQNFGYSRQGAKEICIYVLDNDLVQKFSE